MTFNYIYLMTNSHKTILYTGITNNLIRRVYEYKHHLDKGSFTDRYNAEYLVYYESTSDVNVAIEREKQIKGWNRKRKNKLVESKNPCWQDLYEEIL
jgi:putative endonuclease